MDPVKHVKRWAKDAGITLKGIQPKAIPGRGIGIIATHNIKEGQVILNIPTTAIRSLHSIPDELASSLPPQMSIHGLLAAELAFQSPGTEDFLKVMPSMTDFEQSMPFMWPSHLQELLPRQARALLTEQQGRFDRDWTMFHKSFPSAPDRRAFAHAWFLINSRTFYYETERTLQYPWIDRLALLPVADLFNHDSLGCAVNYTSECYTITADRPYLSGEEISISYAQQPNDYLLVEYGFILTDDTNRWDRICLDDIILSLLKARQKESLRERDMLGGFLYHPEAPTTDKVWVALRLLVGKKPSWQRFIKGQEDADGSLALARVKLREVLRAYLHHVLMQIDAVESLKDKSAAHGESLLRRWQQIRELTERSLKLSTGF